MAQLNLPQPTVSIVIAIAEGDKLTPISEPVVVDVVEAYNVRNYGEIKTISNPKQTTKGTWTKTYDGLAESLGDVIPGESITKATSTITTDAQTGKRTLKLTVNWEKIETSFVVYAKKYTKTDVFEYEMSGCFGENIVLLHDIEMNQTYDVYSGKNSLTVGDYNMLDIPANTTFYGNGFRFDLTHGRITQAGIINLNGTLRDVRIIGNVYSELALRVGDDYGSSAVYATEGAYIYNSYIANTRSPLRTSNNVTIEDSVLFGGRYANVDIVGGKLTIEGTVTTIQQLVTAPDKKTVIGVGVAAWFGDSYKTIELAEGANFVQYNFINNTDEIKGSLPVIKVSGTSVLDLKEPFMHMFGNVGEEPYVNHIFTGSDGNIYANSGMVATDKYVFNYSVTGDASGLLGKQYKGDEDVVTVSTTTTVNSKDEFFVAYDSTVFTPKEGEVLKDDKGNLLGLVKVNGTQIKNGVEFDVIKDVGTDEASYKFQIRSEDYRTLSVVGAGSVYKNGEGSVDKYNSFYYTYPKDMSALMGGLKLIGGSLHGSGLHYGTMLVDIFTPYKGTIAFENNAGTVKLTYADLLEQYIEMTNSTNGNNFYTPDNFEFVNGSIANYWAK